MSPKTCWTTVVAMTDLSEDEGSPRHGMTGDNAQTEIFQAYQAYQVGLDLIQVKLQRVQEKTHLDRRICLTN